jgi:iron complex outermembrane receptor protein
VQVQLRRASATVFIVISLLVLQFRTATLGAQSVPATTGIRGSITDDDGKAIVAATVVVVNDKTNESHAYVTDGNGQFATGTLAPGSYTVEVSARGMATKRRTGLIVVEGQQADGSTKLSVGELTEEVTVTASPASRTAPSQPSLAARSAQSHVSEEFIRNNTSPAADYSQVLQAVPGMFSYNSNGPGLADTKTFFRGFKDGQYNIGFDGIPFYDTNDPTHHSWVFFPTQFLGGTVVDRGPGSAASIGPTTFGGSVNLQSRNLSADPHLLTTLSYGSFATQLIGGEYETGGTAHRFLVNGHDMRSDGYQSYNQQQRDAVSGKYQYAASPRTTLTAFSSYLRLVSNTPDWKDPLRSQIATLGDNYLMSNDSTQANYWGYEHYHVTTDFSYFGVRSALGNGWSIDDKVYLYAYHNHENFNAQTGAITPTSGTDKLNAYRTFGNILPVTQASRFGVFRTGLWSQISFTNRYQTPEDPRTLVDASLPNFHETFDTTSLQPYMEYELHPIDRLKVTPGVKYSYYKQDFVQFADNGKTVGNLGGQPSISHDAAYKTWLPSFDVHYLIRGDLAAYGQFAEGDAIPPTKVFDVTGANVGILPKPTVATTYQTGMVWQGHRMNLGADVFHTHFDNTYSSAVNRDTGMTDFFAAGASVSKGFEFETNVVVGGGFNVYLNSAILRARYADTGLYVANSPNHTETVGITFARSALTVDLLVKHAASMYNDNSNTHQAILLDPISFANLSVVYVLRNPAKFSNEMKLRFSVMNLLDDHSIVNVTPASKTTSVPSPNDQVALMAGRSVALTVTFDFARW